MTFSSYSSLGVEQSRAFAQKTLQLLRGNDRDSNRVNASAGALYLAPETNQFPVPTSIASPFTGNQLVNFIEQKYPAIQRSLVNYMTTKAIEVIAKERGLEAQNIEIMDLEVTATEISQIAIRREGSLFGLTQNSLKSYFEPNGPRQLQLDDLMDIYKNRFKELQIHGPLKLGQAFAEADLVFAAIAIDGEISSRRLIAFYHEDYGLLGSESGNMAENSLGMIQLLANFAWRMPKSIFSVVNSSFV